MKFVFGQPALRIGKSLVIADLHIGIECEVGLPSAILARIEQTAQQVQNLIAEQNVGRLIILGDVKHLLPIHHVEYEKIVTAKMKSVFAQISDVVKVVIIKGNHDGGLSLEHINIVKELLVDGILFTHGHRWPSRGAVKACKQIVCAHTHPCWAFVDSFGHREVKKIFVIGSAAQNFFKKYNMKQRAIEIIVMPAFNTLICGTAINECEMLGPLLKNGVFKNPRAYLLDGTQIA